MALDTLTFSVFVVKKVSRAYYRHVLNIVEAHSKESFPNLVKKYLLLHNFAPFFTFFLDFRVL